ncbi:MAG: hypothetical protein M1493_00770 [Firmicutes bacterium]|nr:hypothetical protein [Bacillota bacterium]
MTVTRRETLRFWLNFLPCRQEFSRDPSIIQNENGKSLADYCTVTELDSFGQRLLTGDFAAQASLN